MGCGCSAERRKGRGGLYLAATDRQAAQISNDDLMVVLVVGQSLHGTGATAQYRQNDRALCVS